MLVKDYIGKYFEEAGITQTFGVSGANIEDLYSALYRQKKVAIALAKNEYNAAMMAIGSYLSSKIIKPVLTTSGAGVLNALPVLAEGYSSKIPFVLISGAVPQALEGRGAFQDTSGEGDSFDLMKVLAPCTEAAFKVKEASEVPKALSYAFYLARKTKRPTAVVIPKNIFNQEISAHSIRDYFKDDALLVNEEGMSLAHDFISRILHNPNQPPLVVLGEDLIHSKDHRAIQLFAKNINAKVALTPVAKGLYDHFDNNFLGLTGVMGHDEVNQHLKKTQDVIFIGSQMDMLSRFSHEEDLAKKRILIFNNEKSGGHFQIKGLETIELIGDIEKNIFRIAQDFGFHNDFPDYSFFSGKSHYDHQPHANVDYLSAVAMIEKELEPEADVFVDAGNSGAFVIHNLKVRGEGLFYVSLGMGGMGNSIGASIGSCFHSRKKTYVFVGDGSFLMHGLEIHTAIQHGLPIVYFIMNNNAHAMCTTRESIFLDGETGTNNFKPSYLGLGFDRIFPEVQSFEVNTLEELRWSLVKVKNPSMPCIVSINIDDNTKPPFRTFIKN